MPCLFSPTVEVWLSPTIRLFTAAATGTGGFGVQAFGTSAFGGA